MKAAVDRTRNKGYYRVLHVPIWIYVFFTLPGALTADFYAHGFSSRHELWLAAVAAICIWRGARGRLPGCEPRPYITHYGLDWPNLGYRVVCYSAAWIAMLAPWSLNLAGLAFAALTGRWVIAALYGWPYDLVAAAVVLAAAFNRLPRARRSVYGEGAERAWFYVALWTAVISQAAAWIMWRLGPALGLTAATLVWARLAVFAAVSAGVLGLGLAGLLPRTRRYHVSAGSALRVAAAE